MAEAEYKQEFKHPLMGEQCGVYCDALTETWPFYFIIMGGNIGYDGYYYLGMGHGAILYRFVFLPRIRVGGFPFILLACSG